MRLALAVCSGLALVAAVPAGAAVITDWDASSGLKPDAVSPAWYFGGDQDAVLAGGALTITGRTYYEQGPETTPPLNTLGGFDIEARLRYVSGSTSLDSRDAVTFFFSQESGYGAGFFIGDDRIFLTSDNLVRGATAYLDTHGFHTYRLVVGAPDAITHIASIAVYRDGVATLAGSTFSSLPANGTDQRIGFGGGSLYASGVSDWLFVRNTALPEPASWAMMLAGFGAIGVASRRRAAAASRAA